MPAPGPEIPGGRRAAAALRWMYVAVAWGALAFALAVPMARQSHGPSAWYGTLAHWACAPFCHQLPARSLWIGALPMPVCIRCFGLAAGAALGCLVWLGWPWRDLRFLNRLFLSALAVITVDWALNFLGLYKIDWLRFATGAMLGATTSLLVLEGLVSVSSAEGEA